MDHYKVLEVHPGATQQEIKAAYKRLAKMYHPDINKSPRANLLFQHISESYRVLSDRARRADYDASRRSATTFRQYPPYEGRPSGGTSHRRNPHSYRSSTPLRQEDLIRPYMKYAYAVSWVGFLLALILAVDYFAPTVQFEEHISESHILPGAMTGQDHGRPQLIYTNEGTRMEVRAGEKTIVLTSGSARIEKSRVFRFPRRIHFQDGVTLRPIVLIYAHLSFFPMLLFLSSSLGTFFRGEIVFDFNVCLVAGVLTVITAVILVTTL